MKILKFSDSTVRQILEKNYVTFFIWIKLNHGQKFQASEKPRKKIFDGAMGGGVEYPPLNPYSELKGGPITLEINL